jgi:hypothetical protein
VLIGYLPTCYEPGTERDAHRQALADAGCGQVVEEQPGTEGSVQPELDGLLARLQSGDVLVVLQLDSLARSLPDLVGAMQRVAAAGAGLCSLAEALDASAGRGTPSNGPPIDTNAALGRPNRHDGHGMLEQLTAGHPAVPPPLRRRRGGRPPKLSWQQQGAVLDEVLSGRHSATDMARRYRVSEATISRLLAARRAESSASSARGQAEVDAGGAGRIGCVLPASVLHERLAIVGTSGSGKTYAAKGLLEQVMTGGGRVCVVDPLGVWWGLREGADGAAPPFPVVVFGGAHADVPLRPGMATALGQLVGTHQLACVVDVSDLGSVAARRVFMTKFTQSLYQANTEPLHLVFDEADLWAPQRAQPDGYDLLQRVEEIVRRGRIRGFVPWLITQRPAVLHKDVLSQADVLVSMKLTSSQDREAVGRWIEGQSDRAEGRRILGALPRLACGEGWVWAPSDGVLARVVFPRIRTRDSSQTPWREGSACARGMLAPVDLPSIRAALAAFGEDAPDKEAPVPAGRAHVSDLVHQLQESEAELAVVRAHLARMKAEAARPQSALDCSERRIVQTAPGQPD